MYSAIISAEVIGAAVLLILGYTEIKHYHRDKSSWCFLACVCVCFLGLLADVGSYIILDYYPDMVSSLGYVLLDAFSYGFAYSFFALVYRYYVLHSTLKSGVTYNVLAFVRYVLYLLGIAIFVYVLINEKFILDISNVVGGIGGVLYTIILLVVVAVSLMYVVVLRRYLEKLVFKGLAATVFFLVFNEFVVIPFAGVDLSYAVYAITLLMIHSLVRDSLVNLSQVEATEAALRQSEELNAMLQVSYKKMEDEHTNLEAIAALFNTMYMLDVEEMTFKEMVSNDRIRGILDENVNTTSMQERLWKTMLAVCRADYKDDALAFTNLFDLMNRMNGKSYIALDIINQMNSSWRLMFIRVGGKSESVKKVLFVTQPLEG